jgi:hypothetical protein
MKRIPLTQGKYAIIDDEDFGRINKYKWHADYIHGYWYAKRSIRKPKRKVISQFMHQLIMDCPKGLQIDHKNHDTLDNRKVNLRVCTHAKNHMNQRPQQRKMSSKYKGVTWAKRRNKWQAQIGLTGEIIYLGYYSNEIMAAKAYDIAAKKYFGEFAYLNFNV